MEIEFDNYFNISNMSVSEILETEKESRNMEMYGKFGQDIF